MTIKLTERRRQVLADALRDGYVLKHGGLRWDVLDLLQADGLLTWHRPDSGRTRFLLTDKGREAILAAPDKESSASRQHYIDTGRYLKYADTLEGK